MTMTESEIETAAQRVYDQHTVVQAMTGQLWTYDEFMAHIPRHEWDRVYDEIQDIVRWKDAVIFQRGWH